MRGSEYSYRNFASIGDEDLLELHDGRIGPQPLMHRAVRHSGEEELCLGMDWRLGRFEAVGKVGLCNETIMHWWRQEHDEMLQGKIY